MARVIFSLPSELLEELDTYVEKNKYNRSECLRHAIRLLVQKEEKYVVRETIQEENDD
jgi:metal-responsive CopG/Arc/MetJ family transcriptional regulator